MVVVRKAILSDLDAVLEIYKQARLKFAEEGTYQWHGNYPNEDDFYYDIKNHHLVVACKDDIVVGVMTIQTSIDENYENCDTVKWLNENKYIAIHRIAVSKNCLKMGVGSSLIKYAIDYSKIVNVNNIKVDTHERNFDMKKLITKFGFVYCGKITLLIKKELRDAYQKVIE